MHTTIMIGGGGGRHRHYKQGRGHKGGLYLGCWKKGRGPTMAGFKSFLQKGPEFGKKHVLPQLKEIGMNILLDILEGKNAKQALKSNFNTTKNNIIRQQRRRRRRTTSY